MKTWGTLFGYYARGQMEYLLLVFYLCTKTPELKNLHVILFYFFCGHSHKIPFHFLATILLFLNNKRNPTPSPVI